MRRLLPFALLALACGFSDAAPSGPRNGRMPRNGRGQPPGPGDFSLLARGSFSASVATGAAISGVTHARTSAVACRDADGELVALTSNQPCLEPDGLRVENAATNRARESQTLDNATPWFLTNSTLTANAATAPDGTATAERLESDAASGGHGMGQGVNSGGAGPWAFSVYVKPGEATYLRVIGGALGYEATFDLTQGRFGPTNSSNLDPRAWMVDAGGGWWRVGVVFDSNPAFYQVALGRTAHETQAGFSQAGVGLYLWGAMAEETRYMTSPVVTTSAAVTRAAVTASITNPLLNAGGSWCLRATVTPDADVWDDAALKRGLLQLGDTEGAANTASIYADTTGQLVFSVVDAAGAAKTLTTTKRLTTGQRVVRACNQSGTLSLSMDSTAMAGAVTGTGTGIVGTEPATLYLGSLGAATRLNGRIMDICAGGTATSCPAAGAVRAPTYVAGTLRALGDSLTDSPLGVENSWPAVLDGATSLTCANDADGGKTAIYHADTYVSTTRPASPQYVAYMSGINDTILNLASNRVNWMIAKRILDDVAARGWTPILIVPTPFKDAGVWTEAQQTEYDELLTYYRAWCALAATPCYDANVDMADGVDPLKLAPVYDLSDHVHLSQDGNNRIAAQVRTALGL